MISLEIDRTTDSIMFDNGVVKNQTRKSGYTHILSTMDKNLVKSLRIMYYGVDTEVFRFFLVGSQSFDSNCVL